jgi:hypothetical protein
MYSKFFSILYYLIIYFFYLVFYYTHFIFFKITMNVDKTLFCFIYLTFISDKILIYCFNELKI